MRKQKFSKHTEMQKIVIENRGTRYRTPASTSHCCSCRSYARLCDEHYSQITNRHSQVHLVHADQWRVVIIYSWRWSHSLLTCIFLKTTPHVELTDTPIKGINSRITNWFLRIVRMIVFSSPEPSGSQGELIVYTYSGVRCRCRCRRCRRQQCLNIFSSETALPIKAKFHVEPPWEGGTKVCINGPGHMTKMAAMPIYGKNL